METISVSIELPVQIETLFHAWLDSAKHSLFTGSHAEIDPVVGGRFNAWEGYISGKTLEIEAPNKIVQIWRTIEFADSDPDSRLEIILETTTTGTRLTLNHSNIPDGQGNMYREGWEEYYFRPMLDYFCE